LYNSVGSCQQTLLKNTSATTKEVKADNDLFELEFGPICEMNRFLSWEIMHLQTINDVVRDLEDMINQFEFQSVSLLRPVLEKLVPQKHLH
jgi:hypothetical protein